MVEGSPIMPDRDLSIISRHGCVHCDARPGEGHLWGCTAPHLAGLAGYPPKENPCTEQMVSDAEPLTEQDKRLIDRLLTHFPPANADRKLDAEMVSYAEIMADHENRWIEYLYGLRPTPPGEEPFVRPDVIGEDGTLYEFKTHRDLWRHRTCFTGRPESMMSKMDILMRDRFMGYSHTPEIKEGVYYAGTTAAIEEGYNQNPPAKWPEGPIHFIAPTGRPGKVLREKLEGQATTIHSILYGDTHPAMSGKKVDPKMVIIDECDPLILDIESDSLDYAKFTNDPDILVIGGKEFAIRNLTLSVADHVDKMTHWVPTPDPGRFDISGTITAYFEGADLFHDYFERDRLLAEEHADMFRRHYPEMLRLLEQVISKKLTADELAVPHDGRPIEANNRAARRRAGRRERKKDWKSNGPHHP
jgi:hypothetical protein